MLNQDSSEQFHAAHLWHPDALIIENEIQSSQCHELGVPASHIRLKRSQHSIAEASPWSGAQLPVSRYSRFRAMAVRLTGNHYAILSVFRGHCAAARIFPLPANTMLPQSATTTSFRKLRRRREINTDPPSHTFTTIIHRYVSER